MEEPRSVWSYIPVAEFVAPTPPASDAARGSLRRVWNWVKHSVRSPSSPAIDEMSQWDRPADELLKSVSHAPDWSDAASELANKLGDDWFKSEQPTLLIQPLVGPPGCDISGVLQTLAKQRRLRTLAAPDPKSILESANQLETTPSGDSAANAGDESSGEILVVPHLEKWYLRHEDGLTLVRQLVEQLITRRNRVLIGCDSWAWTFLQHAVGIEDILGPPLTLAPLDEARLDTWLRRTLPVGQIEFRRTSNEQPIFPELTEAGNGSENEKAKPANGRSDILTSLAVVAHGNPGVARAKWNACLRTYNPNSDESPSVARKTESVLWVVSPDKLTPPQFPVDSDRMHRFVLHAVLLHGGLSLASLLAILPFSRDEIYRRVRELCRAHFLDEQDDVLRVNLVAYPIVRRDLQSEGFLTDAF
ncbi:hypothetical protein SH528x_002347 [Novipirellula sp. SH528]|uniref:hypothetical protein n=1 Tax=Novipirellula sp. SH528 TaxID=3454466 RepID=UPI003F9F63C6